MNRLLVRPSATRSLELKDNEVGYVTTVSRSNCPLDLVLVRVIEHAAEGMSNKEIEEHMGQKENWSKEQFRKIFRKLGISDRAAVVMIALRKGWIA